MRDFILFILLRFILFIFCLQGGILCGWEITDHFREAAKVVFSGKRAGWQNSENKAGTQKKRQKRGHETFFWRFGFFAANYSVVFQFSEGE